MLQKKNYFFFLKMNKINCLNRDILPNIKPFEKKKKQTNLGLM